ncbi:Zinc finger, PARP-type [Lasallia pustulata]|uniref:Zinc finger, PARP-type n=1 Tax=Lasallia pustulata TaxID=136370 RepID=A0A1W5D9D6_9LECA|nr:Zinc finger, PARP-type [Lasallia pustulata]
MAFSAQESLNSELSAPKISHFKRAFLHDTTTKEANHLASLSNHHGLRTWRQIEVSYRSSSSKVNSLQRKNLFGFRQITVSNQLSNKMPGVYRLEYASSKRAGCRNAECKKADIKIEKNELRFGTQVPFEDKQSWHWKHWGCITPAQIASLNGVIEGNLDYLDGYEDLTVEDQVKVQRALENGHVDDEDWKGDLERNRPGKKGFRTPAHVLKQLDNEDNENGSPSQRTPKKRGHTKHDEDDVDDEVEKPATKKAKAAPKKTKKGKMEEADKGSIDEVPLPKKARVQRKKVKEEDGSEVEAPPPKKARGQTKKVKAEADEASDLKEEAADDPTMHVAAPTRTRLPRKAAEVKAVKEEEDNDELDDEMVDEAPKAKPGRKKVVANGAAKTVKGAKKGGAADAAGPKNAPVKASRTKAA